MIRYACPRCRSLLESPTRLAEQKVGCPHCGQRLQLPPPAAISKTVLATPAYQTEEEQRLEESAPSVRLLKCLGKAIAHNAARAVVNAIPFGGVLYDIADQTVRDFQGQTPAVPTPVAEGAAPHEAPRRGEPDEGGGRQEQDRVSAGHSMPGGARAWPAETLSGAAPNRLSVAPLGLAALGGAVALLGVLVGVLVLAANNGPGDSTVGEAPARDPKQGQALASGDTRVDKTNRAIPSEKPPLAKKNDGASDSKKELALARGDTRVDKTDQAIPSETTLQPKVRLDKEGKVRTLAGHGGCVRGVVFLPDGRRALSGASDKTVRLWDLETGKELRRFIGHAEEVTWVALAPDGTRFASASGDRSVRIWDIDGDRALRVLPNHPGPLTCVAFSPDGQHLLSVGSFQEALIWDWEGGKVVKRINVPNGCWCAAFGPGGGETFAVTPGALIWLFTGNDPKPRVFQGHTQDVHGLAISRSGTLLASSSFDGTVRLWDGAQAKEVRCFKEHTGVVNNLAFSPDGRRIVSAGSADRVLRLWETDTGQQLRRMDGHGGNIPCVAISPDGRYALSGGEDSNLILWKLPE